MCEHKNTNCSCTRRGYHSSNSKIKNQEIVPAYAGVIPWQTPKRKGVVKVSSKKSKKRSTIDWKKVLNLAIAVVKLVTQIIILFITLRDLGLYKPYPLLLYSSITKNLKKV